MQISHKNPLNALILLAFIGLGAIRAEAQLAESSLSETEILQLADLVAVAKPAVVQSCLGTLDQALKNGYSELGGESLQELRAQVATVRFLEIPEYYHFRFTLNQGKSAFCKQGDRNKSPTVYFDSSNAALLEGEANGAAQALQSNLCLHEAFCALGLSDENYSASILVNSMAAEKKSAAANPLLNSGATKHLFEDGKKLQLRLQLARGGSGTSIGGGGDLESLVLKKMLLSELQFRARQDEKLYNSLLPLVLDCEFNVVDMRDLQADSSNLTFFNGSSAGVYAINHRGINRIYFYIDQDVYNADASKAIATNFNAMEPLFEAIFLKLQSMHDQGYSSCNGI